MIRRLLYSILPTLIVKLGWQKLQKNKIGSIEATITQSTILHGGNFQTKQNSLTSSSTGNSVGGLVSSPWRLFSQTVLTDIEYG